MQNNRNVAFLVGVAGLLLCSCSADGRSADIGPTEPGHTTPSTSTPATPTDDDSPDDDSTGTNSSDEDTTDDTADLLLAQQITATGAGNGAGPECRTPETSESPIAYLSDGVTPELGVTLPFHVGVCVRGFDAVSPVTLTVDVAARSYETVVHLSTDPVEYNSSVTARQALFNGAALNGRLLSETDMFQTESWEFVPPSEVRDGLVDAGELILTASQDSLSSSLAQPVDVLPGPQQAWLDSEGEFAIWGFRAELGVPVGLYRRDDPAEETFSLVRQLDIVRMPPSEFAVFTVPDDVMQDFGGDDNYCISAPIEPVYNCSFALATARE